jgi:Ribosomal protein S6
MPSYCRFIKLNYATYLKRRQYPTEEGERYFDEARFITATFDASPKLLNDVERLLRADEGVLRFYTTRTRNNVSKIRGESFRNRYLNVLPMVPPS